MIYQMNTKGIWIELKYKSILKHCINVLKWKSIFKMEFYIFTHFTIFIWAINHATVHKPHSHIIFMGHGFVVALPHLTSPTDSTVSTGHYHKNKRWQFASKQQRSRAHLTIHGFFKSTVQHTDQGSSTHSAVSSHATA